MRRRRLYGLRDSPGWGRQPGRLRARAEAYFAKELLRQQPGRANSHPTTSQGSKLLEAKQRKVDLGREVGEWAEGPR